MGNTFLTTDKILLKALDVLHAKLNFIGSINRQYDDQFAQSGGKIGSSLRIRMPEKFTVTDGATLDVQDSAEQSQTLTVATRKHVGMSFTTQELTMSMDEFTERKIEPAMSTLASVVEADALNMVLDIPYVTGTFGTSPATLDPYLKAKAIMNQNLAPKDNKRTALIPSSFTPAIIEGLKGLFQSDSELAKQYREGVMGQAAGFTWAENDLIPVSATGTRTGTITIDGAAPTGSAVNLKALGSGTTIKKGEVFTIAGYYAVHPETKAPYSHLQQFVVTEDATASGTTITGLKISPAIVTSGAYQNVYGTPGTDAAVILKGGATTGGVAASESASTNFAQSICYHKDAFTFVTADLDMPPNGTAEAFRKTQDGLSLRIVRGYDIVNDVIPCRIDILYGYKTIRPELACRVTG